MSVAEKMRALDADERDEPGERLWLALPQIVAVVEAATLIADYGHEADDYEIPPKEARRIARDALAALDKALS